ncbi:MAG TPA: hypothetical protein VMU59_02780 [Caulobacteraceae bacterium]|nr:hypothetical protein [Caulobacteraceae bacterium]
MAEPDDKPPGPDPRQAREDRLAKALRANLRRRKAGGPQDDSHADPPPRR